MERRAAHHEVHAVMEAVFEELKLALISAHAKEPEQLTDFEKVAIAWAAGCEVTTRLDGTLLRITTKNMVGIQKCQRHGWVVSERRHDA
jgi:hypothetical protein